MTVLHTDTNSESLTDCSDDGSRSISLLSLILQKLLYDLKATDGITVFNYTLPS